MSLTIAISGSDVDSGMAPGDENILFFSALSSDTTLVMVSTTSGDGSGGGTITFDVQQDQNGSADIMVIVIDNGGLSDSTETTLTVYPINDAPVIEQIDNQVTDEEVPLTIPISASDVENDVLTLSAVSSNPDGVVVTMDGDQLTMTPTLNFNGTVNITVTSWDGFLEGNETFATTVDSVNDAPVVNNVAIDPSIPGFYDDLNLSYNYFDVENDEESGTIITWYRNGFEQEEFSNQLTVPASATACDEVWYATVISSDGELFGEETSSNEVTPCGDNTTPEWQEIVDQNIFEDSGENVFTMDSTWVTDAEQSLSQITFTVEANSDTVNLDANFVGSDLILTTLVENYNTLDPINLTLIAFDGDYTDTTDIHIYIDPVNDEPLLTEIGDQITDEDMPLVLTLVAEDIDEDSLTFSAISGDTSKVTVEISGAQLILTPAENYNVTIASPPTISVTVSDGELEDVDIFVLIVNAVNDAPVLTDIGNQ